MSVIKLESSLASRVQRRNARGMSSGRRATMRGIEEVQRRTMDTMSQIVQAIVIGK